MTPAGLTAASTNFRKTSVLAWVILIGSMLAVAAFDLSGDFTISYERDLRWTILQLATGHSLHMAQAVAPLGLVQVALGWLLELVKPPPRVLRLEVLPFLPVTFFSTRSIATRLGASDAAAEWAALCATCSPLVLTLATGLMTDVIYMGLLLAAAVLLVRWLNDSRGAHWLVLLAVLATLQRQVGAGIAVAALVALPLARRQRPVGRADWTAVVVLLASVALALELPRLLGTASPNANSIESSALHPQPLRVFAGIADFAVLFGLAALPGLPLLLGTRRARSTRLGLLPVVVAALGVGLALVLALGNSTIFPGDWFGQFGLTPVHLRETKPALLPLWLFFPLEAATLVGVVVVFVYHSNSWRAPLASAAGVAVLVLVLAQFPVVYADVIIDRHYIPMFALAMPLFAAGLGPLRVAASAPRLRRAVGVLAGVATVFFLAAEQDAIAWHRAAGDATAAAARTYGASAVGIYDGAERLPDPAPGASPKVDLEFAPDGDPRPGYAYSSLASGKIVLRPR